MSASKRVRSCASAMLASLRRRVWICAGGVSRFWICFRLCSDCARTLRKRTRRFSLDSMLALPLLGAVLGASAPGGGPPAGRLTACVIQAQSLENLDENNLHFFNFGDTSDPYATLRVNGESCQTTTLWDHENAVWNHCCSFGTVPSDTPLHVILTDEDPDDEDELIGLACTSVSTGVRWLDLIRHDSPAIVGSVNVAVVFELLDDSGDLPKPLGSWLSVNGTGAVSCPRNLGYALTDCICREGPCHGLDSDPEGEDVCRRGASNTHLAARCLKPPDGVEAKVTLRRDFGKGGLSGDDPCEGGEVLSGAGSVHGHSMRCLALDHASHSSGLFALNSWATNGGRGGGIGGSFLFPLPFGGEGAHERTIEASCPAGFSLAGCRCGASNGVECKDYSAVYTQEGSCRISVQEGETGGGHRMGGQRSGGAWAEARCVWMGDPKRLLELNTKEDADKCKPLADADAQYERQREDFLHRLTKQTKGRHPWDKDSVSWWRIGGDDEEKGEMPLMGGLAGLMGSFFGDDGKSIEPTDEGSRHAHETKPVFDLVKGLDKEGSYDEGGEGELPPAGEIDNLITVVKDAFGDSSRAKQKQRDEEQDERVDYLEDQVEKLRRAARDGGDDHEGEAADEFVSGILFTIIVACFFVAVRNAVHRRRGAHVAGQRQMLESELNMAVAGAFSPPTYVSPLPPAQGTLVQALPLNSVPVTVNGEVPTEETPAPAPTNCAAVARGCS